MKKTYTLHVNGEEHQVTTEPETPLLYILRNNLQLNGPKFGCGLEQCGACMVHLDGECGPSCKISISKVENMEIKTIESLRADDGTLHPVQQAFIEEQAAQCGYCTNGLVMNSVYLFKQNAAPSEDQIKDHLKRNICRCGVHARVVKAVQKAAKSIS